MKHLTTDQAIDAMEKKLTVIAVIEHKLSEKLNLRRGLILAVNNAPTEETTTARFVSDGEAWERPVSRLFLDDNPPTQYQYHDEKPAKDPFNDRVLFENFCQAIAREKWSGALSLITLAENIKDDNSIMQMKDYLIGLKTEEENRSYQDPQDNGR